MFTGSDQATGKKSFLLDSCIPKSCNIFYFAMHCLTTYLHSMQLVWTSFNTCSSTSVLWSKFLNPLSGQVPTAWALSSNVVSTGDNGLTLASSSSSSTSSSSSDEEESELDPLSDPVDDPELKVYRTYLFSLSPLKITTSKIYIHK